MTLMVVVRKYRGGERQVYNGGKISRLGTEINVLFFFHHRRSCLYIPSFFAPAARCVFLCERPSRTSHMHYGMLRGWVQEGDKGHEYFIEHERDQTGVVRRSSAEPINIT